MPARSSASANLGVDPELSERGQEVVCFRESAGRPRGVLRCGKLTQAVSRACRAHAWHVARRGRGATMVLLHCIGRVRACPNRSIPARRRAHPVPPRGPAEAAADGPLAFQDPAYREAVVDLLGRHRVRRDLGVRAAGRGRASWRPTSQDKVAIDAMATAEFGHVERLLDRLDGARRGPVRRDGAVPRRPSTPSTSTPRPSDWLEGLVKAYVGDGLADDFYREIAAYLDADTRDLVARPRSTTAATPSSSSTGSAPPIAADPRIGGRLALWGRRLMGEALTQAQRVAAERDALVGAARRRRGPARARPGRDRADVQPAHRAARRADGRSLGLDGLTSRDRCSLASRRIA